ELTRWLVLRPLMARRKVAIVDGADALNEHGQNALLKTLEEPPGASVLLLVVGRSSLLLPTVRSRCQQVRLAPLSADDMARFLQRHGVSREQAPVLVARSAGSPGRALALRDDPQAEQRGLILERLGRLRALTAADLSALAQTLARGDVGLALEVAAAWYRDLLGLLVGDGSPLRNPDVAPVLLAAAARSSIQRGLRQLEAVCDTIEAIERNANRPLAFETLLLELRRIDPHAARDAASTSAARP